MSDVPDDLKYTNEHEWVRGNSGTVRVGITDYAQEALGDVVYVSLPEVGASVAKGQAVGEVESTKSVSDIYAPVSGKVAARNESLDEHPELINSSPYGDGWVLEIEISDQADIDGLLDASGYSALTG
ncbi:MAG TPA: glycine cleavage system protein GcvH [Jatrophihabitans sp.]|jgi:glycine cleavage system H protein|nr:glycine cleavage system protein GcvH [Jatrophihabitans sp.]